MTGFSQEECFEYNTMPQQMSSKCKLHRIEEHESINNSSLVDILNKHIAKKAKNNTLQQRASDYVSQEYQQFLKRQLEYQDHIHETGHRLSQQKNHSLKMVKQGALLKQKKRSHVRNNKVDMEEISERSRREIFDKQRLKQEKCEFLHQSLLERSHFVRSNSNAESSLRIQNKKTELENIFSEVSMKTSLGKLERTNHYLKEKEEIHSLHVGRKDREIQRVTEKNGLMQSERFNHLVQKYLTTSNSKELHLKQLKQSQNQSLQRRNKGYDKRKLKANLLKSELWEEKENSHVVEYQSSLSRFSQIEKRKKQEKISWKNHIEENRAKIEVILRRNEAKKNEDKVHKERLVELHNQKIKDIQRFEKEMQKIKMGINSTFLTS